MVIKRGTIISKIPENLEEQFCEPDGWRWHSFEHNGRTIRYGTVSPKDSVPHAVVVCLHGVREFSEKYFETARWCLDNNLAFWTMDWMGQGKSDRYLPSNPQKRHAHDFGLDIQDLNYFITAYVKPASVHPDRGRIPLVMLAHSMGANIGLRYLSEYPDMFECAAFTSPMIGIKAFKYLPQKFALGLTELTSFVAGKSYIPGGADWGRRLEHARLSSDPVRKDLQTRWKKADPTLRCGDVTFGWVRQAQKSCIVVQRSATLSKIKAACFFAMPQKEDLVDNSKFYKFVKYIPNAEFKDYENSAHEILMEKSEIRDDFLNRFFSLIQQNVIERPETLKPF